MFLKGDASAIEWRIKVHLANDEVGIKEILSGFDLHSDNQQIFGLPNRTIAKNFLYQMIYDDAFGDRGINGPAWSYAHKPDFAVVSSSPKFWEKVITKFFEKYKGVHEHSVNLIREATTTGQIVSPTGRFYRYKPVMKYGKLDWDRSKMLNYIVQGLANDLMALARKQLRYHLGKLPEWQTGILLINTVHDDIELDVDHRLDNGKELVYNISSLLEDCFSDIPKLFEKTYGHKMIVPMAGEVKIGFSLYEKEMIKFKRDNYEEIWQQLSQM